MQKGMLFLGLGRRNLVSVKSSRCGEMLAEDLRDKIRIARESVRMSERLV